jgi:hypothetical protein
MLSLPKQACRSKPVEVRVLSDNRNKQGFIGARLLHQLICFARHMQWRLRQRGGFI